MSFQPQSYENLSQVFFLCLEVIPLFGVIYTKLRFIFVHSPWIAETIAWPGSA